MKTATLFILLLVIQSGFKSIVNDKYIETMLKNITAIYQARDLTSLQQATNAFARIAEVEKDKWEPLYYMAFGNVMMANHESDGTKKDTHLDAALKQVIRAKELAPSEAEIIAMEGFIHMMRVTVDPQSRGMVYAPKAMQAFQTALAIDPDNPRALGLLAQMEFGTAQFFGSPVEEACARNAAAEEKLRNFKSANPLMPTWGKEMIVSLKEKCN